MRFATLFVLAGVSSCIGVSCHSTLSSEILEFRVQWDLTPKQAASLASTNCVANRIGPRFVDTANRLRAQMGIPNSEMIARLRQDCGR